MKKEEEDILVKGFRRRLEDYSEPVPDGLWEALDSELSPAGTPASFSFRKMLVAAVLLGTVLVSVGLWLLNSPVDRYVPEVAAVLPAPAAVMDDASVGLDSGRRQANRATAMCERLPLRQECKARTEVVQAKEEEEMAEVVAEASVVPDEEPVPAEEAVETRQSDDEEQAGKTYEPRSYKSGKTVRINRGTTRPLRTSSQKKLSWGITYANVPGVSNNAISGFSTLDQSSQLNQMTVLSPNMLQATDAPKKARPMKDAILGNIGEEVKTNVKHKTPITTGLSFRYGLSKNFAIETGLTYTMLSSEIEAHAPNGIYVEEYKHHYLGIPLKGNWMFWNSKYVTLYLSAGGELEKSLTGKYKRKYIEGSQPATSYNENVKQIQWSVLGSVGIQFNATEHFGIYAEPGVVHYFDDGSDVLTIRKEKPTNLNLQFGLRWTY